MRLPNLSVLNWPIKIQLRIGFAAMLLCSLGVGAGGLIAARQVQDSVTTSKAARDLLGDIPQMLTSAQDFSRDGDTASAAAVRDAIASLSQRSSELAENQPEIAESLSGAVADLNASFSGLTTTRSARDSALANLDSTTASLVQTSYQVFADYKALEAYRSTLAITNDGKMNNLNKIAPRLGNMRIAAIVLEQEAKAFVSTPDEDTAAALSDRLKALDKDAKAVRRTVKTKALKDTVKKLTKAGKNYTKLVKAHLKAAPADRAPDAWETTFGPATQDLVALTSSIVTEAEAPIEQLTAELRAFEQASSEIALLSNFTQGISRDVMGVRSAYAEYLNTASPQTEAAFTAYLQEAETQLAALEDIRQTALQNTTDKAFRDLMEGPLQVLVEAGTADLPKLGTTFEDVVTSTQAQRESHAIFSSAAATLSDLSGSISKTAGLSAVGSAGAAQTQISVALAAALVIGIGFVVLLSRAIIRPLQDLTNAMRKLQNGETRLDLSSDRRNDEIGDMARAVGTFRDREVERVELEAQTRRAAEASRQRQNDIDKLVADFRTDIETALSSVNNNMLQLDQTAEHLAGIAHNTTTKSEDVAHASGQASDNVQTIAAATEELSASVQEAGRQVNATMNRVQDVTRATRTSNDQIQSLSSAAERIGAVVQMIQEIAGQTNLLALNATIEAARAGEAGRGFAVVAAEVKELATQTSNATDEISSQITEIQTSTGAVVTAISEIIGMMDEVNETAAAMAASVEQQTAAASEISSGVAEAASQTANVTGTIGDLSRGSGETSQSASQVEAVADAATQKLTGVTNRIDRFLKDVAAA